DMYGAILGLVTLLDLSSNYLVGYIPSEHITLSELQSLNLSRNQGRIPDKIGDMKSLVTQIWAVNEEINDSWGWKNILRIRDEVRQFIVMKVGNGENTSVIYDNWCNVGALQTFITNRDIYNGKFDVNTVVKEIVG
ncbi:RNA-directed DNA polymerase, eukaryota, reverse transcriptase zinc-binding domain protein, partial [Tanacetum coccineum]